MNAKKFILASKSDYKKHIKELQKHDRLYSDTETTGLKPFLGDMPFCFGFITDENSPPIIFNLFPYEELSEEYVLTKTQCLELQVLFTSGKRFYFHNAKFDIHHFEQLGFNLLKSGAQFFCTQAHARLIHNDLPNYSLDFLAKRWLGGEHKSDEVKNYLKKNKCFKTIKSTYKKDEKQPDFTKAPHDMLFDYLAQDLTLQKELSRFEANAFNQIDEKAPEGVAKLLPLVKSEISTTRTLALMEKRGVRIDMNYGLKSITYFKKRIKELHVDFEKLTGQEFVKSSNSLGPYFKSQGIKLPLTEKGNYKTDADTLAKIDHPAGKMISEIAKMQTMVSTFFAGVLSQTDRFERCHTSFTQNLTTGRLSSREPNLQNLKKAGEEDDSKEALESDLYPVRRMFIPSEDHVLFAPDYKAMEFRLALDLSGEMEVIEAVNAGEDVHLTTALKMGLTASQRHIGKVLNFLIIYGGGPQAIAATLGISVQEAKELLALYNARLPNLNSLKNAVIQCAKQRGYICGWSGRVWRFSNPNFAYKAFNYYIQGGTADIMKFAMNKIQTNIFDKNPKAGGLCLQVHDEVVADIHKNHLGVCQKMVAIMEQTYPHKNLPLLVDAEYSWDNLNDKKSGYPTA